MHDDEQPPRKKTNFEVDPILEDEKKKLKDKEDVPEKLKDTSYKEVVTHAGKDGGLGYSKSRKLGFNPVTDKQSTDKYIEEIKRREMVYGHVVDKREEKKREEKRFIGWIRRFFLSLKEEGESLLASVQEALVENIVERLNAITALKSIEAQKQHKEQQKQYEKYKKEVSFGKSRYSSHVEAVTKDRAKSKELERDI